MSELQFLRDILMDLQSRFGNKFCSPSFQLKRQLTALNNTEKQLIKKKVLGR